jgi:hypothetical protein
MIWLPIKDTARGLAEYDWDAPSPLCHIFQREDVWSNYIASYQTVSQHRLLAEGFNAHGIADTFPALQSYSKQRSIALLASTQSFDLCPIDSLLFPLLAI